LPLTGHQRSLLHDLEFSMKALLVFTCCLSMIAGVVTPASAERCRGADGRFKKCGECTKICPADRPRPCGSSSCLPRSEKCSVPKEKTTACWPVPARSKGASAHQHQHFTWLRSWLSSPENTPTTAEEGCER